MVFGGYYQLYLLFKRIRSTCSLLKHFPGDLVVKNPPANAEDLGSTPDSGRSPGEGNGNPPQYSEGLAGYSPWGHKESGMTKQLTMEGLTNNCWVLGK